MPKPIQYSNTFRKHFQKRISPYHKLRSKATKRINQFLQNSLSVKDHISIGNKLSLHAFSITGDIRIVYADLGDHYLFLDIGTHNQVY